MFPSSSDCDDYFMYPEDPQSFEQGTDLPSKLDLMDGLRALEFESSNAPTVLWSSDDCDLYLEDTDSAAYIENPPRHPFHTPNVAQHRHLGSSGDFLGVPQLSPDESPFSVASSISPLTPEGGDLLPDLFYPSLEDFGSSDLTVVCSPFFEQRSFIEDTVCPEQLQEDLACQEILDMPSSVSPSRSISHPVAMLPVDDAELAHEQSSHSVARHPSTERSQLLNLSEGLAENIPPQAQLCISARSSPCPPIQHRIPSPSTSQHLSIIPAEIRRGVKRRRPDDDDDDEDYQPHRTYKRAASSQARLNGVAPRKPRKCRPRFSKRAMKHEEASEERFECSMLIHGCTKSFTRKNDMERHLRSCKFNPDLRSMAVKCPHCQKTLSRKDALLRHIKQSHVEVQ